MPRTASGLPLAVLMLALTVTATACRRDAPPEPDNAASVQPSIAIEPASVEPAPAIDPPPALPATTADASASTPPAPSTTPADGSGTAPAVSADGWQYSQPETADGPVPTARIASRDGRVTLVLESHPVSGRKGHLQLPALPKCPSMRACRITIARDGGAGEEMMVSELTPPDSRLYLFDPRGLWRSLDGVQTLSITYPAADGPATVEFDVSGTDLSQLPRWSR